jgi:predicted HAD superfamily Cof-like phosphohydrolase
MTEQIEAVEEFHRVFKAPIRYRPQLISKERGLLRWDLMEEENAEYIEAVNEENLVEVADALGDMLYILCGTIIEHGLQYRIDEVFNEIQRSNMSKLGSDGKPIFREDGKILKGEGYSVPDIATILNRD